MSPTATNISILENCKTQLKVWKQLKETTQKTLKDEVKVQVIVYEFRKKGNS